MRKDTYKLILAGYGGQGTLTCGQLLSYAAMIEGYNITWYPTYGPEVRGGAAACSVVISVKPVGSPVIDIADVILAASQPAYDKYREHIATGGLILYHSSLVEAADKKSGVKYIGIDYARMTADFPKSANIAMLGSLNALIGCAPRESLVKALVNKFGDKNEKALAANEKAMDAGAAAMKEAINN